MCKYECKATKVGALHEFKMQGAKARHICRKHWQDTEARDPLR